MNCESTEQATTSVLIDLNSSILSPKAMISVGHTKVLEKKVIILKKHTYLVSNDFVFINTLVYKNAH